MKPTTLGLLLACSSVGCGALAPEGIPNIEGTWTMTESRDGSGTNCHVFGTMDITQDLESFIGNYTRTSQCTSGVSPTTGTAQTGATSTGRVGRDTVGFRIGDCDYHGIIVDVSLADQITGSIICTTIQVGGGISTQTGTWQAAKVSG